MASAAQIRKKHPGSTCIRAVKIRHSRRRGLEDQLASLKRDNDELNRAMYEAAQVQRRLCGPRYFRTDSYEFASEIFPVRHLSGDFISVMQLAGDLVFVIGDIAGKGLLAGMWFTHMVGMIRREVAEHGDPAAALTSVDRNLLLTGVEFPLTTLFLARLSPETGQVIFCNAGHPPALLIREQGQVEELNEGGPILGVISGAQFVNGITKLNHHDTLLAYSDGIAECRNELGIEFGTEQLLTFAQTLSSLDPNAMLFSLLAAAQNFIGSRDREDDIALLVLRRLGSREIERSETNCA